MVYHDSLNKSPKRTILTIASECVLISILGLEKPIPCLSRWDAMTIMTTTKKKKSCSDNDDRKAEDDDDDDGLTNAGNGF